MNYNCYYVTGYSEKGKRLIGGIWTAKDQDGIPIEVSVSFCKQYGCLPDWVEAMADARLKNSLNSLWNEMDGVVSNNDKLEIAAMCITMGNADEILAQKKANARKLEECFYE